MSDWVAGLLAVIVGVVFCYQGLLAMRIVIAVWGALVGFGLGASVGADDGGILSSTLSWILAIVLAVVFAGIAYLYYAVSIAIAMASIGFVLGASVLAVLGVDWDWLVVLAGLAFGIVLAILAIAADLPSILLILLSATAGASAIVGGIMLLTGTLDTDQITRTGAVTEELNDDWYWYGIWLVAAISGIFVQLVAAEQRAASIRQAWGTTQGV